MARHQFDGVRRGSFLLRPWPPHGAAPHPPRRPRPARAAGPRRRAGVLQRDLARGHVGGRGRADGLRAGQPVALAPRDAARHPLPDAARPGQAGAGGARAGAGRGRRPAPRVADVRRMGGGRARRRGPVAAVDPGRLRARLLRVERGRRLRLQVHPLLRPGDRGRHPLRRSAARHRLARGSGADLLRARPDGADPGGRRPRAPVPLRVVSAADGRYAPSPTGTLHIGNLRTALLAWLFARSGGGRFLVRMEDLDQGRVRPGIAEQQLEDLRALGLDWDGRVEFQSHRRALYTDAIARLRDGGHLYECFCTRAEIREAASAPHGPLPEGFYPGTCLRLTRAERERKRGGGRPPALRVRAAGARVGFVDRVMGPYEGAVDDFVLLRNDGAPAYQLAVVVADAAQGIGEGVRGADLLDSAPRQLFLARLLGLSEPTFAHVPLVLGPDGARLAKRHGAVTLQELDPLVARRWMTRSLGLPDAPPGELVAVFDPAGLPREPVRFEGTASLRGL